MINLFRFNIRLFAVSILLFLIELFIAIYVHDDFIRPVFGDFLVVVFLYFLVRSFLDPSPKYVAISVLVFSFMVEFSQYFELVERLGIEDNRVAMTVLGSTFSWGDLVAYSLGVIVVFYVDIKLITLQSK